MVKGLPLLDKRILVPTGKKQADAFASHIMNFGGIPIVIPLISFRPAAVKERLTFLLRDLHQYDWVIFTSSNAVEIFFQICEENGIEALPKVAVIGEKTGEFLKQRGGKANFVPTKYVAEVFVKEFTAFVPNDSKILIPKGNLARDHIASNLRAAGAEVNEAIIYETFFSDESKQKLKNTLLEMDLDVLLFTSPSTVDHFMSVVKELQFHEKLESCIIGSIGPVTHKRIQDYGLTIHISPQKYTFEDLVKSTAEFFDQ